MVNKQEKNQKLEISMKDLLLKLKELNINVEERSKGTALKKDGRVLTYVRESPKGIHYFQRHKGKRSKSGYASNKKELTVLVERIKKYLENHEKSKKQSQ